MTDIQAVRERNEHWPRDIGQASEDIEALISEIDRLNAVVAGARKMREECKDYAWNPFEPDNQGNHWKRLDAFLKSSTTSQSDGDVK